MANGYASPIWMRCHRRLALSPIARNCDPAAHLLPSRHSPAGRSLMMPDAHARDRSPVMSRRSALTAMGAVAGIAALAPGALAQAPAAPVAPPSTVTTPPRDFGPGGAPTTYFTDPDVLTI